MSESEFLVTQKEAAEFLQVSTKSISRYRKRGLPHQFILNPVTGKQEVRFRRADLERWHEGRQLLATYGRDGDEPAGSGAQAAGGHGGASRPLRGDDQGLLQELLAVYREEIEILRDQVEDMREQLARRDRQIDDLMRLMVGLQLEYRPLAAADREEARGAVTLGPPEAAAEPAGPMDGVYAEPVVIELPHEGPPAPGCKVFSRDQLAASVLQLRRRGKGYADIARGLNRLGAATLSGRPEWTVADVQALLPPLVGGDEGRPPDGNSL